jgi:hypothetical protein
MFPPGLPLVVLAHFRVGHGGTGIVVRFVHELPLPGIRAFSAFCAFGDFFFFLAEDRIAALSVSLTDPANQFHFIFFSSYFLCRSLASRAGAGH